MTAAANPEVDAAVLETYDRLNRAVITAHKTGDPRLRVLTLFRRQLVQSMTLANLEMGGEVPGDLLGPPRAVPPRDREIESAPREELSSTGATKHQIPQHTLH